MRTRNLKGLYCNTIVHVFQEDFINDDLDNDDESDREGEPADVNSEEEEEDNDDDGEEKLKSFTGFTVQNKHG